MGGVKVTISRIKGLVAMGLSAAAMFVAATSSSMCISCHFEEVKMPKSLYKRD